MNLNLIEVSVVILLTNSHYLQTFTDSNCTVHVYDVIHFCYNARFISFVLFCFVLFFVLFCFVLFCFVLFFYFVFLFLFIYLFVCLFVGLIYWKRICAGYCFFLYISIDVGDPIIKMFRTLLTDLTPHYFYACPKIKDSIIYTILVC